MENIFSPLWDQHAPALRIDARIEDINPVPANFQWPAGVTSAMFKKAVVTATFLSDFPNAIRNVTLEIGYPDTKGNWLRRNSASYICQGESSKSAVPLIWDAQTAGRHYQTAFSWPVGSKAIQLFIRVSAADASVATQQYQGTMTLNANSPACQYFLILTPDSPHEQNKN